MKPYRTLIVIGAVAGFLPVASTLASAQTKSIVQNNSVFRDYSLDPDYTRDRRDPPPSRAQRDAGRISPYAPNPDYSRDPAYSRDPYYLRDPRRTNYMRDPDYTRDPDYGRDRRAGRAPARPQVSDPEAEAAKLRKLFNDNWPAPPPQPVASTPVASIAGADEGQVNRVRIEYEPPKNPAHQELYERMKERQVLEMMQHMLSPFRFPVELTIKAMGCDGEANAWFNYDDPDESIPTVHMCYELLQEVVDMKPKMPTKVLGITPHDAIVGQFLMWTMHEVGHAVYHLFEVPLFGREEDAADEFAFYLMLQFGQDQAHRWVEGAAYSAHDFLKNYKDNPTVERRLEKFSSTHGLPEQRFYNGLCMAYGADPRLFTDLVDTGMLPKTRAKNCDREYQTYDYAFKTEIVPHIDPAMAQDVMQKMWFAARTPAPEVAKQPRAAKQLQ